MLYITIYTFQLPHKANIAKSLLESRGIEVFLMDELTVQSHNFLSNAVGGVKLQVPENDVTNALNIMYECGYEKHQLPENHNKFLAKLETISPKNILLAVIAFSIILGTIIVILVDQ